MSLYARILVAFPNLLFLPTIGSTAAAPRDPRQRDQGQPKASAAFFKLALFRLGGAHAPAVKATNGRFASIVAIPNPQLIELLCEYFGFGWRAIDWHSVGITNWAGLDDYQKDRRRTYVLNRI